MDDEAWCKLRRRNRIDIWSTRLALFCMVTAEVGASAAGLTGRYGLAASSAVLAVACFCLASWHPSLIKIEDDLND